MALAGFSHELWKIPSHFLMWRVAMSVNGNISEWVYGLHAVSAALEHTPQQVSAVWVERQRQDRRMQAVLALAAAHALPVQVCSSAELAQLVGAVRHQGVAAQLLVQDLSLDESALPQLIRTATPALLLALDTVQDPHNLGACLRSAAAAGVQALLLPADRAATVNATVRKVACGAAEIVPLVTVVNLVRALRRLQEQGMWIVGAVGEAQQSVYALDLTLPTVLVVGNEEKGLRRLTRQACDHLVRIPLAPTGVSSLNVSVATGILLFEARRQRGC